jgi:hypothetical protein
VSADAANESKQESTESGVGGVRDTNTRERRQFEPWCPIHEMHPNDCFFIHYPNARGNADDQSTP